MKRLTFILVAVLAVAGLSSCGGSKEVAKQDAGQRQEVFDPCGDKGMSTPEFFRASAMAASTNQSASVDKAMTLAKQRLASGIETKVKNVTENYMNDMEAGGGSEYAASFESMTRTVTNQTLRDVAVTCKKTFQNNGQYETYIALEVSKDVILNGFDQGISRDKKLEVIYDREKFREKFDSEMNEFKNNY